MEVLKNITKQTKQSNLVEIKIAPVQKIQSNKKGNSRSWYHSKSSGSTLTENVGGREESFSKRFWSIEELLESSGRDHFSRFIFIRSCEN